jgi:hypothetical protein
MTPLEKQLPAIPASASASVTAPPPQQLKLIIPGLSPDRRHVHVHFITDSNHVTTIQLQIAVAMTFHTRLGEVLASRNALQPTVEHLM